MDDLGSSPNISTTTAEWSITTLRSFAAIGRTRPYRARNSKSTKSWIHVSQVWADRERSRLGSSVEPMLQWAKVKTIETESQFIPCKAGVLSGVVYANGDVSVCEQHFPIGNLREKSFFEIWDSEEANRLRSQIKSKACFCTNEIFMWSSIVFQPVQLTRAMVGQDQRSSRHRQASPRQTNERGNIYISEFQTTDFSYRVSL